MTDRQIAIGTFWIAIISLVISVIALFFQDSIKYYFMSPEEKKKSDLNTMIPNQIMIFGEHMYAKTKL